MVENLLSHDGKELLHSIKVEDWQKGFWQVQFGFEELVALIAINMSLYSLFIVLEYLVLEALSQVKDYFIRIWLNGISEEIDFKFYTRVCQVLKGQSEFSIHYKNLNGLSRHEIFTVGLQELYDVTVSKDNLTIAEHPFPFVGNQNWYEVDQLNGRLLILVHLCPFDIHQFVGHIISDEQIDLFLEHMLNHIVIRGLQ